MAYKLIFHSYSKFVIMEIIFSKTYKDKDKQILHLINNFQHNGKALTPGKRNSLKIFDLDGEKVNIKSFRVPNRVNKFAYRFLRKSKAERSFSYAHKLLKKGIGTPFPIAYAEETSPLSFEESYYVSQHLDYDLTYRELVSNPDYPHNEEILRAFTRFTFDLHEKQVKFLDHSPGNTLIQIQDGSYHFFLVDLNRMNFGRLSYEARMKNFARLTPRKEMVKIMASEYARLYNKPESEVFEKMWNYTKDFQKAFQRKRILKKKLKFWKDKGR